MLSASELLDYCYQKSVLPESGGLKDYSPDGSEEQATALKIALDQYYNILCEQRICRKMNLTVASWDRSRNVAIVETIKGNSFRKQGWQTKEGILFNAEETLFLVDQGVLELKENNIPLSFHAVFMLILPILPSLEYYQAYAYLCRLGYIVRRYRAVAKPIDDCPWGRRPPSPKQLCEEVIAEGLDELKNGYMQSLWNDDVHPLIRPIEAQSTALILSKIKVIESLKLTEATKTSLEFTNFKIDFDVFNSKEKKKSELVDPLFRIVVCKYDDPPPSLKELSSLTNQSNGVHLKLAVIKHGTVTFYGCFGVDLPTLISV
ncbi:tRNA-splicing endonuclease subunit Sen54 isoform X2 [Hydra vulgaris]|uniref:tRNA-splicing endonuclease subunit Sen54 isoform X2 n=1 Tax=Hydra vulgaris TaxID=6087 RepID=A0ABM4CH81_HYDVU